MSQALEIGILWCSYFNRSFWSSPGKLEHAYRPPTLFASKMRDGGHEVQFLLCDEILHISDLDGTSRTLQDGVQVLYVMTHGEFLMTGYEVGLHQTNWKPGTTGIGQNNLTVAIFDTCELIDTAKISNWQSVWGTSILGPNLR